MKIFLVVAILILSACAGRIEVGSSKVKRSQCEITPGDWAEVEEEIQDE